MPYSTRNAATATRPTLTIGDAADHGARAHASRAKVGGTPVHARDYFFREVERALKKGKQKNQLQQSRGAPNVAIEARENSRIDNRRRGRA
jgi:hypothetical protein